MAPRPQQQPPAKPATPGLKVVEKQEEIAVPGGQVAPTAEDREAEAYKARQAEAAARRRLHPPRVWPD